LNPPYDDCVDGDIGHEDVSSAVISGSDAPPIFQSPEHVLDLMALFILGFAIFRRGLPAFALRNTGFYPLSFKRSSVFIGIVALVRDHGRTGAIRQRRVQDFSSYMIGNLSGRQTHRDGSAFAIAHGMQLGVQSALRAANVTGKKPPFTRLDAVR